MCLPRLSRHSRLIWLGYWAVLFIVMHVPEPKGIGQPVPHGDKAIHFVAYLLLTLIGGWHLTRKTSRPLGLCAAWACIYVAYGAIDEWLQQFVNRTPSVADWLADTAGVVVGSLILAVVAYRSRRANAAMVDEL